MAFKLDRSINKTKLSNQSSKSASCPYNDKVFCQFFTRLTDAKKYYPGSLKLSVQSINTAGEKTSSTWQTDGKDKGAITTYKNDNFSSDTISIGKDIYIKNTDRNSWTKEDLSVFNAGLNFNIDITNIKQFVLSKTVQKLNGAKVQNMGTESCGNQICYRYKISIASLNDSQEFLFFDSMNYKLIKTHSEAKNGYREDSSISYDSVNIKVPSPLE